MTVGSDFVSSNLVVAWPPRRSAQASARPPYVVTVIVNALSPRV